MSDDKDKKGIKDEDLDKVSGGTRQTPEYIIQNPGTTPHGHGQPPPIHPGGPTPD